MRPERSFVTTSANVGEMIKVKLMTIHDLSKAIVNIVVPIGSVYTI